MWLWFAPLRAVGFNEPTPVIQVHPPETPPCVQIINHCEAYGPASLVAAPLDTNRLLLVIDAGDPSVHS
jgi:hypothetical protein